jgi:hypothetical protein
MLYDHSVACKTREEFDAALEEAHRLTMATDYPIRIMGSCSPSTSPRGDGTSIIMFCLMMDHEIIYSVRATPPLILDREIFKISRNVKRRLRGEGKIVCFDEWDEPEVSHVLTIPWYTSEWQYGMEASDADAIYALMKYDGSNLRRTKPGHWPSDQ